MININTEGTLNIKSTSDLIFKGVSTEVDRLRNEAERDLIIGPRYLSDPAQIISTKDLFISTTKETTFTDITLESKGNMTLTIQDCVKLSNVHIEANSLTLKSGEVGGILDTNNCTFLILDGINVENVQITGDGLPSYTE